MSQTPFPPELLRDVKKRRTFAIISHPDAGKTTLTEKLLLYGGAIQMAGTVKARKSSRHATSDWMEVEKQRGISVTSSVMQFEYEGNTINLLDTPGHEDFSEDTYRVLTAVDAAVMVIDAAKGVEAQTIKLLEVCRLRDTPIITFVNKFDREVREPFELLSEIEDVLKIECAPITWPLGMGKAFRGVFHLLGNQLLRFAAGEEKRSTAEIIKGLDNPLLDSQFAGEIQQLRDDVDLIQGASAPFDLEAFQAGKQTPVFFGSGINNFGVQEILNALVEWAPPPQPRDGGRRMVEPAEAPFTGFVFKIQANMDPKHRDRIAFIRVCSGKFTRDMTVTHQRTGKTVRLSSSHKLFGQERETVDEAWPGDVIGLVGHGEFGIGDTLTEDRTIAYDEIPRFPSEVFAYISNPIPADSKKYRAGLDQLLQEGVVQSFNARNAPPGSTLLAAVGVLQFEVVQHRLRAEYKAESRLTTAPWTLLRWVEPHPALEDVSSIVVASGVSFGTDKFDHPIVLFPNEWTMNYFVEKNPELKLHEQPIELT